MPELTKKRLELFLDEAMKDFTPITLNTSKAEEEQAQKTCDEYIKDKNMNVSDLNPLAVYFIISKLEEEEQITFIRENINYLRENAKDVFLFTMEVPKSLSYFLSFKVLKEIKILDEDIFKKIISQNYQNLVYGFSQEDYIEFYTDFHDQILEIENIEFINGIYFHSTFTFENIDSIGNNWELQRVYNKEFMNFIIEKYKDKFATFTQKEMLIFIKNIEEQEQYKKFINENYQKLSMTFRDISEWDLLDCLSEADLSKQEILISTFYDYIIKTKDIRKIIYKIEPKIIVELYDKNKEIFDHMTLNDWIKVFSIQGVFNDGYKKIFDTFKIDNIESLFDNKFYRENLFRKDITPLKYIETKYRNNLKINGILEPIDSDTSIFSKRYFKNLKELKYMLKNNTISRFDEQYKKHLSNFILYLKNQNIIDSIEGNNFKEIEKLFYRIVKKDSFTLLYQVSSIEEITILNRLGKISFSVVDFTVEQLQKYNVKNHRQLYTQVETSDLSVKTYKKLVLKLMLMVGFNNTKKILEINDALPVLEHLVGNVYVKNITLDEQGNPLLNNKIMNLLFSDKDNKKIKEMLNNNDSDLYKYFPRIFSEWEIIKMSKKDKSLKTIIEFLKSHDVLLSPKYYRLEGLFKYIGSSSNILDETFLLHDKMLERVVSTIPRVEGNKGDYSYETLKLNDMESLTLGNRTDCCFTVLGAGYSCLKNAVTGRNGRVVVIKKDNQVLAHSWIWRNGDLLCFDNIEISKSISEADFFDVYLHLVDEIIEKSFEEEGIYSCIKNVTVGFTNFDKSIRGIESYPCLIAKRCDLEKEDFGSKLGNNRKFVDDLPQPIEKVDYSDSKNVQYLIRGNGKFNLGEIDYNYQDERNNVMHYIANVDYEEEYVEQINKIVNALIHIKAEKEYNIDSFKMIDVKDLNEVYCNSDWYVISYLNGKVEVFNNSCDKRADKEIKSISIDRNKSLTKRIV